MWFRRKLKPKWRNKDELVDLLESLSPVRVGDDYSEQDRASDFIAVFSGASNGDQGRRVLSQIAVICDPNIGLADADKHGVLAYKAGMRRVMKEIQRSFVVHETPLFEGKDD